MSKPHSHHHHDHDHDHDHDHAHGPGHNHSHDHMHSHVHTSPDKEREDRLKVMAAAFIDGFRKTDDIPAFLALAGIAQHRNGSDGLKMHLIDTAIETKWQLGTASPAFGSRDLVHLPYPASMVQGRETMTFTYVSLTERFDIDLMELLKETHQPPQKD